jgi:hypothetical protein
MSGQSSALYRVRSLAVPKLYVCQEAYGWGRMGTKEEAMQKTAQWWKENLAPDWEKHFLLEQVD